MTVEEVTKEIQKFGYQPYYIEEPPMYWYRKLGHSNDDDLLMGITEDNGLFYKLIYFTEEIEEGKDIDAILEKHRVKFLALVGMDFEEYPSEPTVENLRDIGFINENYYGAVQVHIRNGKVYGGYSQTKKVN